MPGPSPESLINAIITADDMRRRARGLPSTRAAVALHSRRPLGQRLFIEPLSNLAGLFWGSLMYGMPWSLRKAYVQWINLKLSHHSPADDPRLSQRIQEMQQKVLEVKTRMGKNPALFVVTSHPETVGPLEWLRFEQIRQGMKIADAYIDWRWPGSLWPPHPKGFVAIDPFALDTVAPAAAGFYSGWMHAIYLAWDRQPSAQSWIQKHFLLRGSVFTDISWRLLHYLRADIPVVMVLSGGMPYNARLLYAAREFVQDLPIAQWTVTKREAQLALLDVLMRPEGNVWPADDGDLPPATRDTIRNLLKSWGLTSAKVDPALDEFAKEFKLSVPYRARLFRTLAARLGKPVVIVPLAHRDSPARVEIGSPEVLDMDTDIPTFSLKLSSYFAGR